MGVKNTVLSAQTIKGASVSAVQSALANENETAKQSDLKKGEKKEKK